MKKVISISVFLSIFLTSLTVFAAPKDDSFRTMVFMTPKVKLYGDWALNTKGTFHFDSNQMEKSKFSMTMAMRSIRLTNKEKFSKRKKREAFKFKDWLKVDKCSRSSFESSSVKVVKQSPSRFELKFKGKLTFQCKTAKTEITVKLKRRDSKKKDFTAIVDFVIKAKQFKFKTKGRRMKDAVRRIQLKTIFRGMFAK